MGKCIYLVFVACLCLKSGVVFAYNAAGHEISALIAWDLLNKKEQNTIVNLLKKHPRFEQDFLLPRKPKNKSELNKWIFSRAASWPDAPRDRDRYDQTLQQKYHRGRWHYTTRYIIPEPYKNDIRLKQKALSKEGVYLPSSEHQYNIMQAYEYNLRRAKSSGTEYAERALALTWVFHLVGDIHQPLHSTSLFTPNRWPEGDRGGNDIATKENKYAKTRNLHNYWDWALSNRTSFQYNVKIAEKFQKKYKHLGAKAKDDMQINSWVAESHQLAIKHVYTPFIMDWIIKMDRQLGNIEPLILTEDYYLQAVRISEQQVVKSGYRLAEALKEVIKTIN